MLTSFFVRDSTRRALLWFGSTAQTPKESDEAPRPDIEREAAAKSYNQPTALFCADTAPEVYAEP